MINNKGFIVLPLIVIIITGMIGAGILISKNTPKKVDAPTIGSEKDNIATSSASESAKPSNSIPSDKITPVVKSNSGLGGIEVKFTNPGDVLIVRLFDEQLRFINEIRGGNSYSFKNLSSGKYIVGAVGSNYYQPQAVTVSLGKTATINLQRNNNAPAIGSLKGKTFVDSNGNKKYDSGELAPDGYVSADINLVTKAGSQRFNGFSGFDGGPYNLSFSDFMLGRYSFNTGVQPGYAPTSFTLDIGLYSFSDTVDIPYTTQSTFSSPSTVKGKVYFDSNGNGSLDGGEGRPSDYYPSVALEKPDYEGGYRYGTVSVNDNGDYHFSNLSPGKYVLVLDEVPGYSAYQSAVTVEVVSGKDQEINLGLKR